MAIIEVVAYIEMTESLSAHIDETLQTMGHAIIGELDDSLPPQQIEGSIRAITNYKDSKRSTRYRLWMDDEQDDLFVSDAPQSQPWKWLHDLPPNIAPPEPGKPRYLDLGQRKHEYRAIWIRHDFGGRWMNILVAHDSHEADIERQEFRNLLLVLGSSVILIGGVVSGLMVRLGLSPIVRTARRLRKLTHTSLDAADLRSSRNPVELIPFIDALENLLHRLHHAMLRQKEFTSDASHELRTPLAAAKSSLQLARMRQRSAEEYQQAIDAALIDLARVERLTGQLLDLARLEDSVTPAAREPVHMDELASVAASRHADEAGRKGCRIETDLSATIVFGEDIQLLQVLDNLLENAIRHGPVDQPIRLTVAERDGQCEVSVHDCGGNIPPESLPNLFNRFYRVDRSRTQHTGGTGLGLAIVREIVQRHGGQIDIKSNPQKGTTVRVRLPLSQP